MRLPCGSAHRPTPAPDIYPYILPLNLPLKKSGNKLFENFVNNEKKNTFAVENFRKLISGA